MTAHKIMDELNKPYNPKDHEDRIYKLWEDSGYFAPEAHHPLADNPNNLSDRYKLNAKRFCITMAPPNVTGSLHIGHALEYTLSDVLVRLKRMQGYQTLWLPGTDHAGIATQNAVEKELKKEGLTRHQLGREKFAERVWQWKEKYGGIIISQLKKLGASADWSRTRFTMDAPYAQAVYTAFKRYYDKGWIYQGERAVNWCPRCSTCLSDLEVEHKEEDAEWYEIKYGPLVVGTVRPETKLGDTAIAVNPQDPRYQKYIGQELEIDTALGPAKVKVIADPEVDMDFGTGAMKVTPAHDLHDFELAEKYGLEKKQVIGPDGKMTDEAGKYAGLTTKETREQIVKDLQAKGLLLSRKPYRHRVAVCYRCGTALEPVLSKQWFLKMGELARAAKAEIESGRVKFYPPNFAKPYCDWLDNICDWTISRQIWWGHRLPVWQCKCQTDRNSKFEIRNSKLTHQEQENYIVSADNPNGECKTCGSEYQQVPDVLDTWFSSALWPFAALGWPEKTKDLEKFYPTDVITNDRGIINLWDSRMIFSGLEFMGAKPFYDIIIHATVLTKDGQRMSKSLGTGVDPLDLIEKHGADAVRFALMWQAMGAQDIRWQQEAVLAGQKFLNKIWNATRFVLRRNGNPKSEILNSKPNPKEKINQDILDKFETVKNEVAQLIENYQFGQALRALYDFFWHDFCDKYLEASKKMPDEETNQTLLYALAGSLKLLHPFIPFITETLWSKLPIKDKKVLMVEEW